MAVLTDALRKAIDESGLSLYRIAKDAGLSFSVLSRFYNGHRGLQLESADKLAEYFELELSPRPPRRGKRKK